MSNYVNRSVTLTATRILFGAAHHHPNDGIQYTMDHRRAIIGLAISQIFFGIFLVGIGIAVDKICGNVAGCYYEEVQTLGTNIWGGQLVVFCASFSLLQGCKPSRRTIRFNFALSMVGIFLSLGLMGLEIASAAASQLSGSLTALHSVASVLDFAIVILFVASYSRARVACGGCKRCCSECFCNPYSQQQTDVTSVLEIKTVQISARDQQQRVLTPSPASTLPQCSKAQRASVFTEKSSLLVMGVVNQSYTTDISYKDTGSQ